VQHCSRRVADQSSFCLETLRICSLWIVRWCAPMPTESSKHNKFVEWLFLSCYVPCSMTEQESHCTGSACQTVNGLKLMRGQLVIYDFYDSCKYEGAFQHPPSSLSQNADVALPQGWKKHYRRVGKYRSTNPSVNVELCRASVKGSGLHCDVADKQP